MHGSHSHPPGQAHTSRHATNERRMGLAALITGLFMFVEIAGGIISGSLALLADAGVIRSTVGAHFGRINAENLKRAHALIPLLVCGARGRVEAFHVLGVGIERDLYLVHDGRVF